MDTIKDKTYDKERALYALEKTELTGCNFAGPADGESALKECRNIKADGCYFDLRYPMWHCDDITLHNCTQTENCRAALWYDKNLTITDSRLGGIKAVRECKNVTLKHNEIVSPEFGWRTHNIIVEDTKIDSQYAFFEAKNIRANGLTLKGKYTFQYIKNSEFRNCSFDTKDAFWHSKNVTVYDSFVGGEYLGWYSEGLTLVRCHIKGTQPLCYCKNLTLIDCTTEDCDLTFEYSDVKADIKGRILSVKNPESGRISADEIGELIVTKDSRRKVEAKVIVGGKRVYPA